MLFEARNVARVANPDTLRVLIPRYPGSEGGLSIWSHYFVRIHNIELQPEDFDERATTLNTTGGTYPSADVDTKYTI